MKIAEIIKNGIPKVGETYISNLPCKDLWSSPMTQKRQVIGYHNFHGLLIIDTITDYYKTLKLEMHTINNFSSMGLKKGTQLIDENSIKKTNLIEKNKFYLNVDGILYVHPSGYSLILDGKRTNVKKRSTLLLEGEVIYEITDIREIIKILKRQIEYCNFTSFYYLDSDDDKEKLLYNKSLDELLDIFYSDISFPTFYLDKIISYKLLEMLKKMDNNA